MCEHQDVICAVVVSYNSPEHLTECISSSLSQVNQIIVIDNSSDAGVRERIRELASQERVAFILNERNEGLGHALNQGIRYSLDNGYAWTLLLDQDSMLSDGMIGEMMRSYRNCSKETQATIAAVVPVAYDKDLNEHIPSVITTKTLNRKFCKPSKDAFVHFHITSGTLLKNEIAGKIGFMDERLFIDYIDFDYCFRILNAGYKILLSRNALLHHSLGGCSELLSFRFREHAPLRVYYQTRNRLFTVRKYGRAYPSFMYAESFRFISKFAKIVLLESDKAEKLREYVRGIKDFMRDDRRRGLV